MEVIIQSTTEQAALLVARLIAKRLRAKPALVLGLATGRTMEQVYGYLAEMHRREKLDFSLCRTFNLDEYVGLPAKDPHSYRYYMDQHLFRRVNIDRRNTHLPNGTARDLAAECAHYEEMIRDCGGVDVQLLGIGADGHIGFNEPLSALRSRTREKALTPATVRQNASLFRGGVKAMPRRALTMGVGTILDASHVLTLVTGAEKAAILAKAVEGPITSMVTASALQLHPDCKVIVDEAAAKRLRGRSYYRWIFQNEPEWQEFRAR
ncbi:MAG: glucosamine-6-phosphate deaminase [Verrucomicrobia bacterium]|nr:glucosamine-6-phosphate deaminase [Verrucomicrobiota bacterium]